MKERDYRESSMTEMGSSWGIFDEAGDVPWWLWEE